MLCVNTYKKSYIAACRAKMDAQITAYKTLVKSKPSDKAVATFEPLFFNNLVLVLESYFMHRARGKEGKDGNPINEVRMLSVSLLQHDGVMTADKTIKYDVAKTVVKIPLGAPIKLTESDFTQLFKAYFSEIESKFTS